MKIVNIIFYTGILIASTSSISAFSTETTPKFKAEMYKGCFRGCLVRQKKAPDNSSLVSVPFVLDAYCSCYCAKLAMKITNKDRDLIIQGKINGKSMLESLPIKLKTFIENAGYSCASKIFADN
jgi:hypothetical protein